MQTETAEQETVSVYDLLEADGWHGIKSPHHMRSYDCFRKGNRRAYVTFTRGDYPVGQWPPPPLHYFAVEAFPGTDSFGRSEWRAGRAIAFEPSFPAEMRARIEAQP